jgi:hypothetical protein
MQVVGQGFYPFGTAGIRAGQNKGTATSQFQSRVFYLVFNE